jgi:hypothetical protein
MPRRLYLAWRLYITLNYSWRLAWHIAAYKQALQSAHLDPQETCSPTQIGRPLRLHQRSLSREITDRLIPLSDCP